MSSVVVNYDKHGHVVKAERKDTTHRVSSFGLGWAQVFVVASLVTSLLYVLGH